MDQVYPSLEPKICKECGKEKMAYFEFCANRPICKECENVKARAKRHKTGTDPKMKWRGYTNK